MADAKSAKNFALPPLPELRETRVFGRRICYYDVGSGMPLVLIHGVGGDADQWAFCMPALAASLRVIAIDLPGFGRSDKPQMDYRIAVSTRANMRLVFETMFHDTSLVTDDLVDLAYSLHLERGDHYAIQSVLETLGSPNEKIDHDLGRISMPTLILWGENDAIAPLAMGRAFQQGIPASRLDAIPACGHVPCLEKSADFAKAILAFVK